MNFERFSAGNSLLHRLDPRVKLVIAIILTLVIALGQDMRTASAGLVISLLLITLGGLGFKPVLLRLLVVNSFTLFLWCTLPFTYPGVSVMTLGPLSASAEGLHIVTLITLKTNTIVLLCISLLATSPVSDLGHAMTKLRMPVKLCLLLLFSYRYIFVIHQEFIRLNRAAKLRCFTPKTNLHTYRTVGYLFGMTLIKSWHRGERVAQAMMLRGFNGRFYTLNDSTLTMTDTLFAVTMVVAALVLGTIEFL